VEAGVSVVTLSLSNAMLGGHWDTHAFDLPGGKKPESGFDVLRRIGVVEMDAFVAVTQGDNRNVMAAQIAQHVFNVPRVVCRIYDPIREEIYHTLGIETISPPKVGAQLLKEALLR